MRAFVFEHGEGCQPLEPCSVCKVFNHLRASLNPDQFATYLELLEGATTELPDPKKEFNRDASVLECVRIQNPGRKKLLEIAPTMGELLKLSVPQLKARGLTKYTIDRIQLCLNQKLGMRLSET